MRNQLPPLPELKPVLPKPQQPVTPPAEAGSVVATLIFTMNELTRKLEAFHKDFKTYAEDQKRIDQERARC